MPALGIAQHLHSQSFLTGSILNGAADKTVSVDRGIERERVSSHWLVHAPVDVQE